MDAWDILYRSGRVEASFCGHVRRSVSQTDGGRGRVAQPFGFRSHRIGRAALPQRFGAAQLIEILQGIGADKIARFGLDRIPTFGVGVERSKKERRSLIRQMAEKLGRHGTVAAPTGRGGGRMRLKRPRPASPDQMRITREGETAVMEYAEPSVRAVNLQLGWN